MLLPDALLESLRVFLPLSFVAASGAPIRDWVAEIFRSASSEPLAPKWLLTSRDLQVDVSNPLQVSMDNERRSILRSTPHLQRIVIQSRQEESHTRLGELFEERWRAWFGANDVTSVARPEIEWRKGSDEFEQNEQIEWANAIFAETREGLGENLWNEVLRAYFLELDLRRDPPWESLRFFSGLLRRQKNVQGKGKSAELAALEWARFQCMTNPQDEKHEWQSLEPNEVILNPAAQILKRPLHGEVRAIVRYLKSSASGAKQWHLNEIVLDWMDAAIVDAIEENFRANAKDILKHVESEYPESSPLRAMTTLNSSGSAATFAEKLETLARESVVLKG